MMELGQPRHSAQEHWTNRGVCPFCYRQKHQNPHKLLLSGRPQVKTMGALTELPSELKSLFKFCSCKSCPSTIKESFAICA